MSKRKTGKSSTKSRSVKPKRRTPSKRRRGAHGPSVSGSVAATPPAATGIRPKARAVIRGIGVSPGVVVGRACCLYETTISLETAEELGEDQVLVAGKPYMGSEDFHVLAGNDSNASVLMVEVASSTDTSRMVEMTKARLRRTNF